jgi:hypothetical protein
VGIAFECNALDPVSYLGKEQRNLHYDIYVADFCQVKVLLKRYGLFIVVVTNMVLHQQKQESHGHRTRVVGDGWTGVNIPDENYTAKDFHLLKVLLFFGFLFL